MKTKCLNPKRYLLASSLMLIGVLLMSYSAIAGAQRRCSLDTTSTVGGEPGERGRDPDYIEKRGEFLNRFFGTGPGGVSPAAYEGGRAMARVLPPSPLLKNESFRSPEAPDASQLWSWPIALPIENSYGGNAGAMVHTLAVDPFNASVVYTGSFGGLAKTTDGGFTWQYLSDAWTDPRTASLACKSGVYKTTDMGATRVQEGVQDLIYRDVSIDPANPEHIFAASNAGVFASIDGGLTWGNLSDGIPAGMVVTALSINAMNRNLAAATFGRGVYMLNVGQSVRPHPGPRPTPHPRP
jgi:hypothetical protein